jgi:basic membrane protein A
MTKTGVLGYVAPFGYPLINAELNPFALGCQSVRPDCKVHVVTTNSWYDPHSEVNAAKALTASGADVLWGFMDDTSVLQVAQQQNVLADGVYTDQLSFAPKNYINSNVWDWSFYYTNMAQSVLAGTWTGGSLSLLGIGQGISLGKWGTNVPADVQTKVNKVFSDIQGGTNPFVGPITDNKGNVRVPQGQSLDDNYLYSNWDWLVKGVA